MARPKKMLKGLEKIPKIKLPKPEVKTKTCTTVKYSNSKGKMNHPKCGYKPEYCDIAREMLREGASKIEISREIGVDRQTIANWEVHSHEFARAISQGLEDSEAWWYREGRVNLNNKNFNARLYEMNMTNRFGWYKKVNEEATVKISHEEALKELK